MTTRVLICSTCAAPGAEPQGGSFAQQLRARLDGQVLVETVACMNLCDRPMSLALQGAGRDTYVFAGVDPARDLEDAAALARLFAEAEGGTITDARPAGRLRHCLVARVPHLSD